MRHQIEQKISILNNASKSSRRYLKGVRSNSQFSTFYHKPTEASPATLGITGHSPKVKYKCDELLLVKVVMRHNLLRAKRTANFHNLTII